jgi:2-dehydro-3-deoxyphosphogluconate aldolase/(4S)-4-hydroxy-2-oxoglutarate aldolase
MSKAEVLRAIRDAGVIPVIRSDSAEEALRVVTALRAGGLAVAEITLTVPDCVQVIALLRRMGSAALVGAGSVVDAIAARACIVAGARFIVSPVLSTEVMALCHEEDVVVIPGALTPTEIVAAWSAGADLVKVFPVAAMGGASYIRALKAPLPDIELVPTGGITLENAAGFIEAGAAAIGVGADLTRGPDAQISEAARAYLAAVRTARGG